ncbi:molybdenum cofactor guanylyltransferase [Arthrobacter monumenti]
MPRNPVDSVDFDAIILAGGRSSRLGGVDKASLMFDGGTLLARTLAAVEGAGTVVVVGPFSADELPEGVRCAREDPPFSGPASAIAAGVDALAGSTAEYTAVLACDMPYARTAMQYLLTATASLARTEKGAATSGADGVMAQDEMGKLQPLAALYKRSALTEAVRQRREGGGVTGMSVFRLVASLQVVPVTVAAPATRDVDTWDDARTFGIDGPA